MRYRFRLHPALMGALGVVLCTFAAARGAGPLVKSVSFDTVDGVELKGTFYPPDPNPATDAKVREATVLLLHNIGPKGGSSSQDGWNDLAVALQKDGYAVLSFDFRGFGNSSAVSKEFWKQPHNAKVKGAGASPPPGAITHQDFDEIASDYYPYLVNDIAAAKAYLDRRNDEMAVNTSSLIVVGVGEGATLGALWMASEWHRHRVGGAGLGEPEGKDQAAAVWVNLSPKLGGKEAPLALHAWLAEASAENKVPMAFLYGGDDDAGEVAAGKDLTAIKNRIRKEGKGWTDDKMQERLQKQLTNVHAIDGVKLSGNDLLALDDTRNWIVNKYLPKVMKERGDKEHRTRNAKDDDFVWTFPGGLVLPAKAKGDDSVRPAPVEVLQKATGP